jgi:S1-C subfamily serine protease
MAAAATGEALDAKALFQKLERSVYQVEAIGSEGTAQGSAVAVTETDLFTNCHVVEGAVKVIVKQKKREWVAKVSRSDPQTDRCVLAMPDPILEPVVGVRTWDSLEIGEPVYALGSPAGLELSLSNGILSGRREEKDVRLVQTTAPISPGSSGGGLFDARGNLVGITTLAFVGRQRLNQALNFAIPADRFFGP